MGCPTHCDGFVWLVCSKLLIQSDVGLAQSLSSPHTLSFHALLLSPYLPPVAPAAVQCSPEGVSTGRPSEDALLKASAEAAQVLPNATHLRT